MLLEIDAQGWVTIIGAIAGASTVIGAAVVGVILAWKNNQALQQAAVRREEIKEEIKS